jgi:Bacterial extracellular solute-binding protein
MLKRRNFIKASAATALLIPACGALVPDQSNRQPADGCGTAFVWQPMVPAPADVPVLNGHTDTIPDIMGRLGSRIDLAIFTEGNQFPALLGGGIIDAFRSWAKSHPDHADLPLDNIVIVTLPQPMIVGMLLGHAISFGNLTLDVSRTSGFFPDIVMAGTTPLKALYKASIVEGKARLFARNRGPALVIPAGNPFGLNGVDDIARSDLRIVMASRSEPGARSQYIAALEGLLGQQPTQAILARETVSFTGRLGIQHRDVPYAVASRAAHVGMIYAHLAQYYAAAFPQIFAKLSIPGAEQFSSTIALVRSIDPLRAAAAGAFSEYFLETARDVYPRQGFATMDAKEFGEEIALG